MDACGPPVPGDSLRSGPPAPLPAPAEAQRPREIKSHAWHMQNYLRSYPQRSFTEEFWGHLRFPVLL